MICPSCNKFPAYSTDNDPEVDLEVSAELADIVTEEKKGEEDPDLSHATVTGSVRIVLTSECCGDELKETTFDVDVEIDVVRSEGCKCDLTDLSVEDEEFTITDRMETERPHTDKKGNVTMRKVGYRGQRRFYRAGGNIVVTCGCGKTAVTAEWKDEVQASGMDEMI